MAPYINPPYDCSFKLKPTEEQLRMREREKNSFVNSEDERIYFDVVQRVS